LSNTRTLKRKYILNHLTAFLETAVPELYAVSLGGDKDFIYTEPDTATIADYQAAFQQDVRFHEG
jgi:hypothetical protein